MPTNNHRRHTRLACEVPVVIVTETARIEARLTDASRSGVRVRVPGTPLGLYRLAPTSMVGRQVARTLGVEFEIQINPERLGSLLGRRLRPVRIGQRDANSADVEIGCVLNAPLSDDEAAMLGLAIPALRLDGTEGDASVGAHEPQVRHDPAAPARKAPPAAPPAVRLRVCAPGAALSTPMARPLLSRASLVPQAPRVAAPSPAPKPDVPAGVAHAAAPAPITESLPAVPVELLAPGEVSATREPWRAYVHPSGARRLPPFVAIAQSVSAAGVQVRVLDRTQLNLSGPNDVASTMAALGDAYGYEVALRIVDGPTHLWTGPARIEMVEVSQIAPHPVTLWLTYGRPLRTAELRALALV